MDATSIGALQGVAAGTGGGRTDPAQARAAAEEFEAVFLSQMMQGLFQGLGGDGPLGGPDNEIFTSMLQDEYARLISRTGGIGVADAVLREMLKLQEVG
jgi:peptidoglycan hydrolase FlgJ